MPVYKVKFKPKQGGEEFEVRNVVDVGRGVSRKPGANGRVGMRNHDIHAIRIERRKSLHENGRAQMESEVINLMAATEQRAYFGGEIVMVSDDDSGNVLDTFRWEEGHIIHLSSRCDAEAMIETIEFMAPVVYWNDVEFRAVHA